MAEYIGRRRTFDLAALARLVVEEELPEKERQLIRMRYSENRTPCEIAQLLGVNKSSVSRTLAAAEEHIRQSLKYVVQYQYDLRHVPFLPLAVRSALVVSGARDAEADSAAARLRQLRVRENLTPQDVGIAVGIKAGRLREIENGSVLPDACELLRLSSFYGVSADYVLKGEPTCRQH